MIQALVISDERNSVRLRIQRGQVLAELENANFRAQVESARANVAAKQAVLRKGINGARRQESDEA